MECIQHVFSYIWQFARPTLKTITFRVGVVLGECEEKNYPVFRGVEIDNEIL